MFGAAIKRTRLSCRSFATNAVRLQLNALAYNLGNFLRKLGDAGTDQKLVWGVRVVRCRTATTLDSTRPIAPLWME